MYKHIHISEFRWKGLSIGFKSPKSRNIGNFYHLMFNYFETDLLLERNFVKNQTVQNLIIQPFIC